MIPYRDLNRRHRFPLVTLSLILINIGAFFYPFFFLDTSLRDYLYTYSVIPHELKLGRNLLVSPGPHPFVTLFTSLFLHGSLLHLIGNLLYLWIFGDNVEERLGRSRFLLFYLLCGLIATMSQVYADLDSDLPMLGASGAIAGVLAAYLWLYPKARIAVLIPLFYFLRSVILPAWIVLLGWIFFQVLSLHLSSLSSLKSSGGVAYFAHIGGFVGGLLLLPAFLRRKKR